MSPAEVIVGPSRKFYGLFLAYARRLVAQVLNILLHTLVDPDRSPREPAESIRCRQSPARGAVEAVMQGYQLTETPTDTACQNRYLKIDF